MNPLQVRDLRPSDLPRLVEMSRPLFTVEEATFGFSYETVRKEFSEYRFEKFISMLTGKPNREFLVGERDGVPICTTMLHRIDKAWYISWVMVETSQQRKGYGKQLVEKACTRARELGADRVILHVRSDNEAARRLYASLGFESFEHEIFCIRESEQLSAHQIPADLGYRKVDRFDEATLAFANTCREPSSAEVYGESIRPHLLVRVYWRLSNGGRFERVIITRNGVWVGMYTLFAPSRDEAAFLQLHVQHDSRGVFEVPVLERALSRSCDLGAPKLALSFDSRRRELAEASKSLGFQAAFESDGMVKRFAN